MYEIVFYEDEEHKSEIKDYFDSIRLSKQRDDKRIYSKLRHQLDLLSLLGPTLHMPHSKELRGLNIALFELRPMPERIFYVAWDHDKYVLLSHYTKKQNRTDSKEINKALRLAQDWFSRKGN